MAIVQISAGSQRSVALDGVGAAWGWGAFKTVYPGLQEVLPAALCTTDKSEIGHRRYAQPYAQMLNPGAPFRLVSDGSTHILGACDAGALLACRPVIAPDHGAAHQTVQAIPEGVRQLAAMQTVSLALLENGDVWSWGFNHQGQLGRSAQPAQNAAAAVGGLPAIASLACGSAHALALDESGGVWSWGANQAGQLGDGTLKSRALPARVELPESIASIAAGDTHSMALDNAGQLWAWGSNNHGQAGSADSAYFTRPVKIQTGFPVLRIDGGQFYTVALSEQGEVFAWGWNGLGQMGLPEPHSSPRAVKIAGLPPVTHLAAGAGHVLASDGLTVFAWGDNRSAACGRAAQDPVILAPNSIHLA
ncbi:MAG TPA: hypothetical protein VNT00_15205 [Eoetvoesiella sp.]|uniref:RCC1 domain-containing protein n=1 Tax=Eoetvoesiella sp. TaxID=1966355 RepID=UPI002CC57283|nr:hypothetical protein [Eoetvoesiella sp.]HWK62769.1 hypothetical protein [Eoetvoesiella sp.]